MPILCEGVAASGSISRDPQRPIKGWGQLEGGVGDMTYRAEVSDPGSSAATSTRGSST